MPFRPTPQNCQIGGKPEAMFQKRLPVPQALRSNKSVPHLKLGYAWLNKGENQKAVESFKKVIEIAPADDPDITLAKDVLKALSSIK